MYNTEEKLGQSKPRLMTRTTYEQLVTQRMLAVEFLAAAGTNETGFQLAHDNSAMLVEIQQTERRLAAIGNLINVQIIEPRQDTKNIQLGNQVVVDYGDGDIDTLHFLGPDDVTFHKGPEVVISPQSPLGQALLGKKPGDNVCYRIDERSYQVMILEVRPGDFGENHLFKPTGE